MVQIDRIDHTIVIPEGVSLTIADNGDVRITGPKGSLSRNFRSSRVSLIENDGGVIVRVDIPRRKEKALAGTWNAHLNNMIRGVVDGFSYSLKAFYSHFPMTLAVKGSELVVNNYFGEKVPRRANILPGVEVKVSNKVEVTVSGSDKEAVGQTAANIERCTKIKNRDRRVFQDGIYLLEKA